MTENNQMIEINNFTKMYGKKTAVDRLNLTLKKGEVFGFLGENGAGKTTTIRALVGLLRPTSGIVRVMGMDPLEEEVAVKQQFGYVSEDRHMYGWMKVKENLDFNRGLYPQWKEDLAQELLKDFDLDPNQKVKSLSRGQGAKLALLGALASRPELLILDEPTSGLDPMVRREILERLVAYCADYGTTVFFSSHLLDDIERLADTVGILCKGKLVAYSEKNQMVNSLKKILVRLEAGQEIPEHKDILRTIREKERMEVVVRTPVEDVLNKIKALNPSYLEVVDMSLEDIFVEFIRDGRQLNGK